MLQQLGCRNWELLFTNIIFLLQEGVGLYDPNCPFHLGTFYDFKGNKTFLIPSPVPGGTQPPTIRSKWQKVKDGISPFIVHFLLTFLTEQRALQG